MVLLQSFLACTLVVCAIDGVRSVPVLRSTADPTSYTLADTTLSATFSVDTADTSSFGVVTSLNAKSGPDVIESGQSASVWEASFVGSAVGTTTIESSTAKCKSYNVISSSQTELVLQWEECGVAAFDTVADSNWSEHNQSNCAGECLPGHSSGPNGGNCDRLPGCGHDAGLPYCNVDAMKARCLNVSGCTAFNTNGYLYHGSGVEPFKMYPLECYTLPPPPEKNVTVTLTVNLVNGILEYNINFKGDGKLSLWDFTIQLANVLKRSTSQTVTTNSAKQLLGIYDSALQTGNAVYVAAHDPRSIVKHCSISASTRTATLGCQTLSMNATLPLYNYSSSYPLAVTVVSGDWWDITQVYREWVLPNAEWTKFGPLENRTDLPDWLENITLWMNNNWGGDPLGPYYGGDPVHVQLEMLKVNDLLQLPTHGGHLALHWYEWDTLGYKLGSNHTKCDRHPAPCGFDTHYPNYFPARVNCKESIAAMQEAGMRVIPYINGQLFDTLIPRYSEENAIAAVQKFVDESMGNGTVPPALTPHLEHFDRITSAVMCPATDYWHAIMRDTIIEAVNDLGFDGVYVDQVGNGETRNCADPNHNHTINGGSFWAEAFYDVMKEVRAGISQPSMFMTEGAVEEVSGTGFDIMLGLQWSELPMWHAIYGGIHYMTGRAGSITSPLKSGLCTELTQQFMTGGTMGWFTYQNYGDQFFDPTAANEVQFIRDLSAARITAKNWMVFGRATRSIATGDTSGSLLAGCFRRDEPSTTIVCAFAVPTAVTVPIKFSLNMVPGKYGLGSSSTVVSDLNTGKVLGTYTSNITYSSSVNAFGITLLHLESSH